MYDTGHGPTFFDIQNRRLRKMEGEGAAQAGLWTDAGSISRHVVGRGRSTATARYFPAAEVGPHHQDRVTFGGGRAFAPDIIGFISPTAKVTFSLMLEERGLVFRLLSGVHHTVCDEMRWRCDAL